jgi:hypothetical protein
VTSHGFVLLVFSPRRVKVLFDTAAARFDFLAQVRSSRESRIRAPAVSTERRLVPALSFDCLCGRRCLLVLQFSCLGSDLSCFAWVLRSPSACFAWPCSLRRPGIRLRKRILVVRSCCRRVIHLPGWDFAARLRFCVAVTGLGSEASEEDFLFWILTFVCCRWPRLRFSLVLLSLSHCFFLSQSCL